jgi:hypothetical protein
MGNRHLIINELHEQRKDAYQPIHSESFNDITNYQMPTIDPYNSFN